MKKHDLPGLRETWRLHRRSMRDIRRYAPQLFLACTLRAVFFHLHPLISIYFSAQIINELSSARRAEVLWPWALSAVIAEVVLLLGSNVLRRWESARIEYYRVQRSRIYGDKLLSLDYADADRQETIDRVVQIRQNEYTLGWGIFKTVWLFRDFLAAVIEIIGAVALTVTLFVSLVPPESGRLTILNHPLFVLLLFAVMGLVIFLVSHFQNRMTALSAAFAEDNRLGNRLASFFGWRTGELPRAMDVRIYHQEPLIREKHLDSVRIWGMDGRFARMKAGLPGLSTAAAVNLPAIFTGCIYLFVCLKAWGGAFGVGSVTQYVGAVTAFSHGISQFLILMGNLRNNTRFLRTSYVFLDLPNRMYQGSLPTEKRADREYEIEFRDVSFRYPGAKTWALRHVSLRFRIGSRVAIVGENGSGKTTLIKLLCRLYDPDEGEILLNGIDIRKYDMDEYRAVFSIVFQDFGLLSQPLGENVAGSDGYDRARAENALRQAGFGERLDSLPEGLDTQLYQEFGKHGVSVSGGEAQKIAIARALYKDAPIIVLDEPTAALDPIAEAEIYAQFHEISGDKTAVYISHRLSSCAFCDEILVFHEGQLIQRGSHSALLADEGGKYHALWTAQAQYYA